NRIFLVFVGDPTGLVTALAGDVGEHSVPALTGLWISGCGAGAAVGDQSEFTFADEHGARRSLRQESAMWAGFAGESGCAALAAFQSLAELVPVGHDVADELGIVHARGELLLDIIAGTHAHSAQIGCHRGIAPGPDEEPFFDQLGDLRALDHQCEDAAESASV